MPRIRDLSGLAFLLVALASGVLPSAEPPLRLLPCRATEAASLAAWQQTTRTTLFAFLNMDDQVASNQHDSAGRSSIPLNPTVLEEQTQEPFQRFLLEIDARADRRIKVVLTIPRAAAGGVPAVVCIHGHGGNRNIVYDGKSVYRGFAQTLAERGYATLSTDVGQHEVQDKEHRTLMGERLWDLIRVVDLAASRPEIDSRRIGCAGLSLGGEMSMWLGAMDPRIVATVSSGFLTTMENLRHGHCMCWDFPGLQRRYEFSDVYSLISPRPLQCQNGKLERLPGGFPIDLAQKAMTEIQKAYAAAGKPDAAQLAVHPEGHVFDVPSGVSFLDNALKPRRG